MWRVAFILVAALPATYLVPGGGARSTFAESPLAAEDIAPPAAEDIASSARSSWTTFPAPVLKGGKRLSLWATHYAIRRAKHRVKDGHPLLTVRGKRLGPMLSSRDWCAAAMGGTVQVARKDGTTRTYNFVRMADEVQVDCTPFYPKHPAIGRSRFKRTRGPLGVGSRGRRLVPFRSIAVDPRVIPLGSLVFIPDAVGTKLLLSSGEECEHDGYFYAADTGGAVDGHQIDVFLGLTKKNPFSFVKSRTGKKFKAYLVDAPDVVTALLSAHQLRS